MHTIVSIWIHSEAILGLVLKGALAVSDLGLKPATLSLQAQFVPHHGEFICSKKQREPCTHIGGKGDILTDGDRSKWRFSVKLHSLIFPMVCSSGLGMAS